MNTKLDKHGSAEQDQLSDYTLTTKRTGKANEFKVTLHHGGRAVKNVTVISTSSRSAYFNDDQGRRVRGGD